MLMFIHLIVLYTAVTESCTLFQLDATGCNKIKKGLIGVMSTAYKKILSQVIAPIKLVTDCTCTTLYMHVFLSAFDFEHMHRYSATLVKYMYVYSPDFVTGVTCRQSVKFKEI